MNYPSPLVSICVFVCLTVLSIGCAPGEQAPSTQAEESSTEAAMTRGEYLVEVVAGCPACHTAFENGQPGIPFAGGLEIEEVAGTWRSTNITQDVETGIGGWTDEEIITAIREGKRPDGTGIVAIMPYLLYNRLSDEDAQAIVDYLRTIAPVSNAVERVLDFPHVPAPPPEGTGPADEPVARGEYLASLMHCVECHTPFGPEGPDHSKAFAGGLPFSVGTGTVWSSNITSDEETGIGHYSKEDLLNVIVDMKKADGSPIRGPMAIYKSRWSRMEQDDLSDLVEFVKGIPAIENRVPEPTIEPAE